MKICSLNVRGIQDAKKRQDIFTWVKKKKFDVYFLQETHSTPSVESKWANEWGYKCFFSSYSSKSRGTAILFNNTFQYTLHNEIIDNSGRFVILDLTLDGNRVTLGNIYGPNDDEPIFFNHLQSKVEGFGNNSIILGGDFNVVQNYTLDTKNLNKLNNPNSNEKINKLKEDLDLHDYWRIQNPDSRIFTWHNTRNQHSRLDYFLLSGDIIPTIDSSDIRPGYRTDHSLITVNVSLSNQNKGAGYWKFNNSLLQDETYIKETIGCITQTTEFYSDNNHQLTIGDQLFYDMLKLEIRGKTIAYTAAKNKRQNIEEKELDAHIEMLYKKYCDDQTESNMHELTEAQNKLKLLREKKIEGIMLRAKARWHLEGERNSKYFCNLENRHYQEKIIPRLIKGNGEEVTEIKDILEEQKEFYKQLYTSRKPNISREDEETFFPQGEDVRKLSNEESQTMEGELTIKECYEILKSMKKNKSPGQDGFTTEFYMHFWEHLKKPMVNALKECFDNGSMSGSQRLGIITCLPKPGKPKEYMKNWRPITLLNVDYKIMSGVIANRIKLHLNPLISDSQKGFVSGRYIGECTRIVSDLIYKLKKSNQEGILLLLDFEKAFDSLEWSFIHKTLDYFNFGQNMKKWIKIFYTNIESCVINNGHFSERFCLQRGVRQGDPLSPYLFILATEIMAAAIKRHKDINGIKVDDSEYLISQLADDTTLMLENSEKSFNATLDLVGRFSVISGLNINYTKTLAIKIGIDERIKYDNKYPDITWQTDGQFTLLGIKYNLDEQDFTKINYDTKTREFEKTLNMWHYRNLTIYGKVCILKSLALPKLVHLFSAISQPPDTMLAKLTKISFNFIWGGKSEKVKRTTLQNNYENGGVKTPNIELFSLAQKLIWIKKLQDDSNKSDWKTLLISDIERFGGNYVWLCKDKCPSFFNSLNPFWKDVYHSWIKLTNLNLSPVNIEPLSQPIFHNTDIKINKKTIFYQDWYINGALYVNDLVNELGDFYKWEEFEQKYNIQNQAFKYYSVIHAIPMNWKKRIKENKRKLPEIMHLNLQKIKHLKKPNKFFYHNALEQVVSRAISHEKWEQSLEATFMWKDIHTIPFKATKETKLRQLQFQILHRIFPTNKWLYKTKLITTPNCTFCLIYQETLEHLFWECTKVKSLWLNLGTWLEDRNIIQTNTQIFNKKSILLGDPNQPHYIEHIKLITKSYIYRMKLSGNQLNIQALTSSIKLKMSIEKMYNDQNTWYTKWPRNLTISLF